MCVIDRASSSIPREAASALGNTRRPSAAMKNAASSANCRRQAAGPSRVTSRATAPMNARTLSANAAASAGRSEEHTSELQSLRHLVCRLLLEKKKKKRVQLQLQ